MTPAQIHLAIAKLWHATCGLYIWEFFTTLDYELKVIRGRLPYRWTIWVYSLSRVAALLGVITSIVIMDVTHQINCQVWTFFSVFFFCGSATVASLLIVLRTIAIWNRNKIVLMLTTIIWGVNIGFHLQNVIRFRSVWVPADLACVTIKSDSSILAFIPTMISNIVFLLIVLAGLLSMRRRGGSTFGLARLLWTQGVIWLIIGCVAEIPPVVLTLLHLNDPLHGMFEIPGVIIMTIAATRMHRSLVDYASSNAEHESFQVSNLAFSKTKQTDTTPTTRDRVEVAVHKAFVQHPTGPTNDSGSSTVLSTKSTCPLPTISPSSSVQQV